MVSEEHTSPLARIFITNYQLYFKTYTLDIILCISALGIN